MIENYICIAFVSVLGAIIGSFLNVLIYRIPKKLSIIQPVSHCTKCSTPIPIYRNIPLISYIIQKGKCHHCGEHISIQYPIVELLSVFIWTWTYIVLPIPEAILFIWIASILIVISWIDTKYFIIPFPLIIAGASGLIIAGFFNIQTWLELFLGLSTGLVILLSAYAIVTVLFKKKGLGFGDILLGMILGAWLGPIQFCYALFVAAVLGLVFFMIYRQKVREENNGKIPFGPFLGGAAVIMYVIDHYYVLTI